MGSLTPMDSETQVLLHLWRVRKDSLKPVDNAISLFNTYTYYDNGS